MVTKPDEQTPSSQPYSVKWVVAQIYKAIKLTFYNFISHNQRLWLSPCQH